MGNEASSGVPPVDPEGRGPGIMYINGVVCSWINVEMRVREWIAAGRDLNQVPSVVTGHDIDQTNPCAMTFLHLAVAMGHERLVQTLLENGAHVSPRDKRGLTPLMYAHVLETGTDGIVALLLRHGADPDRELPGAPGTDPATAGAAAANEKMCAAAGCTKKGSKKCSKCRAVYYCCKSCQTTHWKKHKKECNKMAE